MGGCVVSDTVETMCQSQGPTPLFRPDLYAPTLLDGGLPLVVSKTGLDRLVNDMRTVDPDGWGAHFQVGLYARVSSAVMTTDLDRQLARLRAAMAAHGLCVVREEVEIVPGADARRARLRSLLADPRVAVIAVETADRLAPLNGDLIEACLKASKRRLLVLDHDPPQRSRAELGEELAGVLTRFLRRCGHGISRNRIEDVVAVALGSAVSPIGSAQRRPPRP